MTPLVLAMRINEGFSNRQIGLSVLVILLLSGYFVRSFYSSQGILDSSNIEDSFFILVTGEVISPGVYSFSKKPSLSQIIHKCRGLTSKLKDLAWDSSLPEIKKDMRLAIGTKNGRIFVSSGRMQPEYKITLQIPISINSSSVKELEAIPYIGPSIAKRIINYRSIHGPFKSKEEIMKVKGIGKIRFSQVESFIEI